MKTPEHRISFIRQILLDPDNKSNWLICADWMTENEYPDADVRTFKEEYRIRFKVGGWSQVMNTINNIWHILTTAEKCLMLINLYGWDNAHDPLVKASKVSQKEIQEAQWLVDFIEKLPPEYRKRG